MNDKLFVVLELSFAGTYDIHAHLFSTQEKAEGYAYETCRDRPGWFFTKVEKPKETITNEIVSISAIDNKGNTLVLCMISQQQVDYMCNE
jgi:hypothetical protein